MRKISSIIILSAICTNLIIAANPLLGKLKTPRETIPFNKIKNEHFIPAFDESCKQLNEEIFDIINNPEPPTFENTIIALERSGSLLKFVSGAFYGLLDTENDDELLEIAQIISPQISACQHNTYLNDTLFSRVKEVYQQRIALNLSTEDSRLLQKTYNTFFDKGANLSPADKERYREISTELNLLELKFNHNVLKDENCFELILSDPKDVVGLPKDILEAAALEAQNRDQKGWVFTLSRPSYIPFMRNAANRKRREELYRAKMNVGNRDNEYDNKEIVKKIVNIRLEIARMMGFRNYAEYVLKDRMAQNEENVIGLLQELLDNYKPLAINEYNTIHGYVLGDLKIDNFTVMPWDWEYYSEMLKNQFFEINDEITRPYFELERVRTGIFNLATKLYGITFKENKKIPVYNPDVQAYEVFDRKGNYVAVLYTDFYQRPTKVSGEWMTNLKGQYIDEAENDYRPHVAIVMNFSAPTETKPTLLTYSEAKTFLHEFGHALHGMLSKCMYESLSGTNVEPDFAELPSQIMENWLKEKEFLDQFAVHYETGEKIPADIVNKLIDATNFNIGNECCRQVSFSLLDMAWHTITEPFDGDFEAFEKEAWAPAIVLPEVPNTLLSTSFGHIFTDDEYAAGYYGYSWAEVLEADAFAAFKEAGIFSKAVATSFLDNVLSKGDTDDPNRLYIRFRCQLPTIDALLQRNGIASGKIKKR
ncbi:M3 family metallopeptidase [Bacteroides sp. OttesenSCG-928-D19]|nr:M3 family metallopeptidase [Bacteroides sp. OttesenSCG-928-D19]